MWAARFVDDIRWLASRTLPAGRLFFLQVGIQALAAATGFLFVRSMSKQEFGWLTIATGFLTTVSVMADSGTGAGLQSLAGRIWKDPVRMGQLLVAARDARRHLALLVTLVLAPWFLWLLVRNGASILYAGVLTGLAFATVWYSTGTLVYVVTCRMHARYEDAQLAEASGALTRFAIALTSLATRLNAAVGAAAGLLSAIIQNQRTKRVAATLVVLTEPGAASTQYRAELLAYLKPLALPTLFFICQGQLGVWLIGVFGQWNGVADLGALGRFAALLSIFAATAHQVSSASFARCESPPALRQQIRRLFGGTLLSIGAVASALLVAPSLALTLLGTGYLHLRAELRLLVLVSLISTVAGLLWSVNVARGWVSHAWLLIPATIVLQIAVLPWLSASTVLGVLTLSLLHHLATATVYGALALRGYREWVATSSQHLQAEERL